MKRCRPVIWFFRFSTSVSLPSFADLLGRRSFPVPLPSPLDLFSVDMLSRSREPILLAELTALSRRDIKMCSRQLDIGAGQMTLDPLYGLYGIFW